MRHALVALALVSLGTLGVVAPAAAQGDGAMLDHQAYLALSADQRAQLSIGGFRDYLERTRADDESIYQLLDPRLDRLEERNLISDVIFWSGTVLSVAALVTAIPVHEEVGLDPALGLIVGGVSLFTLTVIIQAVLRPGHTDLMALIDTLDERLGRR